MHLWPGSDLLQLFWFLLTLKLLTFHQEVCNKKKQIIFQQEKQQVVCVSKYVSWHGKKVALFLFFSWNKILDDIRPCLLATSKFGNFPPGCLNPRRDQGYTLLWKQKKCSVNKNHNFLLFTMIKSGGFSKIPINLFFKPSFSTGWSLF